VLETGEEIRVQGLRGTLDVGETLTVYGNRFDSTYETKPPSNATQFVLTAGMYALWAAVLLLLVARVRPIDWARELSSLSGTPYEEMQNSIADVKTRPKWIGNQNTWVRFGIIGGFIALLLWWIIT